MTRSHHETTFSQKKIIDDIQENVEQMLVEINEFDEEFANRYKFRQSFSMSDAISNENDDASHSLNIETIRHLKWWINNHLNDFLKEFNDLRLDRDKYLFALNDFHQFVKIFKQQQQSLFDTDNTLDALRVKFKTIEKEREQIKKQFINKRIEYDDLLKQHEIFQTEQKSHHSVDTNDDRDNSENNENEFETDSSIKSSKKKKRSAKHSDSEKLIDDVNSEWLIWKVNVHDKLTINDDWYETSQFLIIAVIDWIDDKVAEHIQSRRYNNLNYFKNEQMMIFFLEDIYEDSNHQRNVRREYRNLTMFDTQNFQFFYSNFHRLDIQINFDQLTLMKNLIDKLIMSLKQVMNNSSRNWTILNEWKNDIQQMHNDLINIRKKKIRIRAQKSVFTYFKSTSVVSIATSFVKSTTSIFFVKSAIRFQLKIDHKHDFVIDQLIVTSKCFTCEKFDHVWKKSFHDSKFQERQWHKMQMIQMNFDIDSSDSKN